MLDVSLRREIAWVLVSCIGEKCYRELNQLADSLDPVGSWTAFMKDTSDVKTTKCHLEYLPVVSLPPKDNVIKWYLEYLPVVFLPPKDNVIKWYLEYLPVVSLPPKDNVIKWYLEYLPVVSLPPKDNVIKWYLDMILQMADDLEIGHIFVHADKAVISKMYMIMWLQQQKYDRIIPLMGGFHLLLVYLKILYKKYGCLGSDQWWVAGGVIMEKPVKQAIEGKHYYQGIGLHKQSMHALLRCKIKKNVLVDNEMKSMISNIGCKPNPKALQALLNHAPFKQYCADLIASESGTQCQIMTQYVKDVSLLRSRYTWLQSELYFRSVLHSITFTTRGI